MAKGDLDGQAIWKLVLKAIDELLANERPSPVRQPRTHLSSVEPLPPFDLEPRAIVGGEVVQHHRAIRAHHLRSTA